MHGGSDAKQHGDNTCAQNVKSAATFTTRFPVDYVCAIAKEKRAHVGMRWTMMCSCNSQGNARNRIVFNCSRPVNKATLESCSVHALSIVGIFCTTYK